MMSITKTTTGVDTLKINYLTDEMYEEALINDEINENELYFTPEAAVDYIVEQGTTGIWTYRKWQSGIAECWGEYYKSVSASTTDNNNYVQFPFTFTATPIVNVGLKAGGAAYYSAHAEIGSTNTTQARIIFVNNYSGVVDMYAELIVKGRWK